MNEWDEQAEDYAVRHYTYEHLSQEVNERGYKMLVRGAIWQRLALQDDEVVERAARAYRAHTTAVLARENHEHLVCAECGWAFGWHYDTAQDANRQSEHGMRAALTAALGEGESDDEGTA